MSNDLAGAALERLPIFPLPQAHLFPGVLMPLHVFEPRYRQMVRDLVAGVTGPAPLLAIAELKPGYESDYEGRPPVHPVCGLGRMVWHQALPDGRFNILMRGEARVRIEREHPPDRPYRLVRASLREDEAPSRPIEVDATSARTLVARIAPHLPEQGKPLLDMLADITAPALLCDVLAGTVIRDPALRRELLEEPDPALRITRVEAELAALGHALDDQAGAAAN